MCSGQHGGVGQYSCPEAAAARACRGRGETRVADVNKQRVADVTRPGPAVMRARVSQRFCRLAQPSGYLTVTVAPAPSRAALALSALSLLTFSRTVLGAPSTRSLASFRPRLVRLRTSLMT